MKNLFPIAAGVVLCLICTVVGLLIPSSPRWPISPFLWPASQDFCASAVSSVMSHAAVLCKRRAHIRQPRRTSGGAA